MSDSEVCYKNFLIQFNAVIAKSGRDKTAINLIAVSKTQPIEKIKSVYQMGQRHFGENYVQEALLKQEQLADYEITWHFIGGLQKNKVKQIVGKFALIHSVDSLDLAKKISSCAVAAGVEQKCLLQINVGDEQTKGGFSAIDILQQLSDIFCLPNIIWQGLMVMPPITSDEQIARSFLQSTRQVFEEIRAKLSDKQKKEWTHLSMGTSHDFAWAIEEGASMIRIGTLIFGERNKLIINI
jgi:pyridoxal phosphate enzyme (YggS family)